MTPALQASSLGQMPLVRVLGYLGIEQRHQLIAASRGLHVAGANDFARAGFLAVEALVGVLILVQRSSVERHAGKQSFGTTVGVHVGSAYRIGLCGGARAC